MGSSIEFTENANKIDGTYVFSPCRQNRTEPNRGLLKLGEAEPSASMLHVSHPRAGQQNLQDIVQSALPLVKTKIEFIRGWGIYVNPLAGVEPRSLKATN
jgi:hypothetical protein